ncbi:MAG: hypothetical protein MRERV_27c024 [Mycoplasmataceae bacterium RV_VA103A]|nr:MAG: hypothetical protein MRERV_27c024 [Mycoplasmataceae bacterium RV_VA103A]
MTNTAQIIIGNWNLNWFQASALWMIFILTILMLEKRQDPIVRDY